MRWLVALFLVGCAGSVEKGAPALPALGAKQDGPAVPVLGTLAWGEAMSGTLTPGEFQGWLLPALAGDLVTVEVTQKGSSAGLDATLFVYAPDGGGFASDPVAMDDDSGWGRLPRLTHTFSVGGSHLVVVGAFDAVGKGAYRLLATCTGVCEVASCDPRLLAGMKACVQDWRYGADPDTQRPPTTGELVEGCTDAEPVAPVRDAICAEDDPPFCALDYEQFVYQAVPPCRAPLETWVEETACALGYTWQPIAQGAAWGILELGRTTVTTAEGLSDVEAERIVAALHASAHTDVTTAAEAILRTDDKALLRLSLWDVTNGKAYDAWTFHAGDNLFGAVFGDGSGGPVAHISDGDIVECQVTPGPVLHPCATDGDCGGLTCIGASPQTFDGRCVPPGEAGGETCSAEAQCAAGFVCNGGEAGTCAPAWTRATFRDVAWAPIPEGVGAPLERTIQASGLLPEATDARLRVTVAHPAPSQIRVLLLTPAGGEHVVYEGTQQGPDLTLDLAVPVDGGTPANGTWTLRVTDTVKGKAGTLTEWSLGLGSR